MSNANEWSSLVLSLMQLKKGDNNDQRGIPLSMSGNGAIQQSYLLSDKKSVKVTAQLMEPVLIGNIDLIAPSVIFYRYCTVKPVNEVPLIEQNSQIESKRIGSYTIQERKIKIQKFRSKREIKKVVNTKNKNINRTIAAQRMPRIAGRFVRNVCNINISDSCSCSSRNNDSLSSLESSSSFDI